MSGTSQHKFQAPKGTRDWYPADMALRRHIEKVWREVSINHGFEEIDGPTFEHLELYTAKSGPGIVSEIFGVFSGKDKEELEELKRTGQSPYALRPEFTPTLARMYAAQAGSLPKPTKWFCMPNFFRAERPQRGRLREFQQWNVDILGDSSLDADVEVIACCVALLDRVGLKPDQVRVVINDRIWLSELLEAFGIPNDKHITAFTLLDNIGKRSSDDLIAWAHREGITSSGFESMLGGRTLRVEVLSDWETQLGSEMYWNEFRKFKPLRDQLQSAGIAEWCSIDVSIARGLAYYTGTVFEVHETSGEERAIAGGGRYDKLVEVFGGPPTPACGFAMGDVVLANILRDKGLLKPAEEYLPRPDAFVLAATDEAAAKLPGIAAQLRRENLHVRHSYKTTRNVGKLLTDASKARARVAIILGKELEAGNVVLKNLDSGEQREVKLDDLTTELRAELQNAQ